MDYMIELATHPDAWQALRRCSADPVAQRLISRGSLRIALPGAWSAELVDAFYTTPALAAGLWSALKYCAAFRTEVAEAALARQAFLTTYGFLKSAERVELATLAG